MDFVSDKLADGRSFRILTVFGRRCSASQRRCGQLRSGPEREFPRFGRGTPAPRVDLLRSLLIRRRGLLYWGCARLIGERTVLEGWDWFCGEGSVKLVAT